MILALLGCPAHTPSSPNLVAVTDGSAEAAPGPAGQLDGNVWSDLAYPWSINVPNGWDTVTGAANSTARLTLIDPSTQTRIEVQVRAAEAIGPVERLGCDWEFWDDAHYRVLAGVARVRAGTCTPLDPINPRTLGYFLTHEGNAYDFLAHIPSGALLLGKAASDHVFGSVRLR